MIWDRLVLGGLSLSILVVSSIVASPLMVPLYLARLVGWCGYERALGWLWVRIFFVPTLAYSLLRHALHPASWRRWDRIIDPLNLPNGTRRGGLWLAALPLWFDVKTLHRLGIGAIVSLNEEWEMRVAPNFRFEFGGRHCSLPTRDLIDAPCPEYIQEGMEFIDKQRADGIDVLVHCKAGRGRSACLVACYLIKEQYQNSDVAQRWDRLASDQIVDEVVKVLIQKRPQVHLMRTQYNAVVAFVYRERNRLEGIRRLQRVQTLHAQHTQHTQHTSVIHPILDLLNIVDVKV
jgi:hypothetical protein